MKLRRQAETFPHSPGVYLFKDRRGVILYVGKAKNLRQRIRSYFDERDARPSVRLLNTRATQLEYIVTDTEKEALLLEHTLIKQHRPRYNISLRDDKSYASIRVGLTHASPGISLARRVVKDGAAYFGPYTSTATAREAIEAITRIFRVRSCSDNEFANRVRPCLLYDIGRCTAPCVQRVAPTVYRAQVDEALLFLKGKNRELQKLLTARMRAASTAERYEEAMLYRDAVRLIAQALEKQKAVVHGGGDYDAVGLELGAEGSAACVLVVRGGTLLDRRLYRLGTTAGDATEVIANLLLQRYVSAADIPPHIFLPVGFADRRLLVEILAERRGGPINLHAARRGVKRAMVKLAIQNAREHVRATAHVARTADQLERRLAARLGLSGPVHTIECVDISNLSGREAVGAIICFVGLEAEKRRYRLFNIRTLTTPDDYAMMYEVLLRRYGDRRLSAPDLLLVDGGKGQLGIATQALAELGLDWLPVAAIAKGKEKDAVDHIYVPGRKNPIGLRHGSPELLHLMRIRDEAHRFGITAHRRRHERKMITGGT